MRCPACGADDDRVIDSRAAEQGRAIRRRRECQSCGSRFTTFEHIEPPKRITVIKRDGSRVPFDREKIIAGLQKACFKRPVPAQRLGELVAEVEEELISANQPEVESSQIGRILAERLKGVDHVAYVRFASVYKQFRDLEDLMEEVREILDHRQELGPGQGVLFEG